MCGYVCDLGNGQSTDSENLATEQIFKVFVFII